MSTHFYMNSEDMLIAQQVAVAAKGEGNTALVDLCNNIGNAYVAQTPVSHIQWRRIETFYHTLHGNFA